MAATVLIPGKDYVVQDGIAEPLTEEAKLLFRILQETLNLDGLERKLAGFPITVDGRVGQETLGAVRAVGQPALSVGHVALNADAISLAVTALRRRRKYRRSFRAVLEVVSPPVALLTRRRR